MGAWGSSLYGNDTACDVKEDYIDQLRRGKSNEEVTSELIRQNEENTIEGEIEETALFWFALADTQWNYGRLLPEVKEKALFFLEQEEEVSVRWKEAGEKQYRSWIETLRGLKEKLLSPMPDEKKVSKYRLYKCPWKFGDVFAYQLASEYSKKMGMFGKYIIFRKVSEDSFWPGHIVPVVQVYKWIGEEIPAEEEFSKFPLLIQNCVPITFQYDPHVKCECFLTLITTSKSMLSKQKLKYLTNIKGNDFVEFNGGKYLTGYPMAGWEGAGYGSIERDIIDQYLAWSKEA